MNRLFAKLYRIIIAIIILIAGVTFERTGLIELLSDPYEYPVIMELFIQHLYLVSLSMSIATIIGVTAGLCLPGVGFAGTPGSACILSDWDKPSPPLPFWRWP